MAIIKKREREDSQNAVCQDEVTITTPSRRSQRTANRDDFWQAVDRITIVQESGCTDQPNWIYSTNGIVYFPSKELRIQYYKLESNKIHSNGSCSETIGQELTYQLYNIDNPNKVIKTNKLTPKKEDGHTEPQMFDELQECIKRNQQYLLYFEQDNTPCANCQREHFQKNIRLFQNTMVIARANGIYKDGPISETYQKCYNVMANIHCKLALQLYNREQRTALYSAQNEYVQHWNDSDNISSALKYRPGLFIHIVSPPAYYKHLLSNVYSRESNNKQTFADPPKVKRKKA